MTRGARIAIGAGLAAVAIVSYVNSLPNAFVFDDEKLVRDNPWIRSPAKVLSSLAIGSDRWEEEPVRLNYRPLRFISYGFDWQVTELLFGEQAPETLRPTIFRLHNILLHAANVLLVWVIARRILGAAGGWVAAALAALVFAAHPVHVESVAYVSGRRDVLFAFFILAAFALHLAPGPIRLARGAAIAGLYVLALLTKEMAAPFPVLAFIADRTIARAPWRGRRAYYAALAAIAAAFVAFSLLVRNPGAGAGLWGGSRAAAILTMARGLFLYIRLLLWPGTLTVDYSFDAFPVSRGLLDPWTTPLALAGIAAIAIGAGIAWDRGMRWPAFAAGWFAVSLAPVAQIVPHPERLAEHFLYLPSVGIILAAAAAWIRLERWGRPLAIAVAILLAVVLPLRTMARNRDWRDSYTLWKSAVDVYPRCARAQLAYGMAALARGEARASERALDRALEILPEDPPDPLRRGQRLHALVYRGQALAQLSGEDPDALDRAIVDYEKLMSLADVDGTPIADSPRHAAIRFDLAVFLHRKGRFERAEKELRALLDLAARYPEELAGEEGMPRLVEAKFLLGAAVAAQGRVDEGEKLLREAASEAKEPDASRYWREIARIALASGRWKDASAILERIAWGAGAKDPDVLYDLAQALDRQGELGRAIEALERALDADPRHVPSLLTLGDIRANLEAYDEAERLFRRAAAAAPEDPKVTAALNRIAFRRK
ncbi:MAG: tetratricopeptide repeat protein, partial [Planctomycetes bacterium]|nr:tetratricopeptide repeat protein [Planctomycetota bacterium]